MDFKAILEVLKTPDVQDDILIGWLTQLSENISLLDHENEHIVGILLKLPWAEKSKNVSSVYIELILHLVTAHTFYLRPVLKMIQGLFLPGASMDMKPILSSITKNKTFINAHKLLRKIIQLIPMASSLLVPILIKGFPFMKKEALIQVCYTHNILEVTKSIPNLRKDILTFLVHRLLQIDVHCPKSDIEAEEANAHAEGTVFPMEEDDDGQMRHSLANTLDLLMQLTLSYIDSICKVEGSKDLDWESTKKLYKEFLTIFDIIILPTYAIAHVQFLMFYICSYRQALCEGYLDYLWKKVQNPSASPIIRQTAACYIGSLLSRAKYVSINMVKDCLLLMTKWVHGYIDNQAGSSQTFVDVVHHGTFYTVCQTIFYVFAFRHRELVEDRKGLNFLRSLNLDRVVACRLNPLKVCLPSVLKNFANVARNYQIAYCYTIIERNNRMLLPAVQNYYSGQTVITTLDTFFPFDPYVLRRSGMIIEPLFRAYDKQDEEMQVDKEDEDDFLPDHASTEQPTSVQDFLSYGTSPGFKQVVSPKFR